MELAFTWTVLLKVLWLNLLCWLMLLFSVLCWYLLVFIYTVVGFFFFTLYWGQRRLYLKNYLQKSSPTQTNRTRSSSAAHRAAFYSSRLFASTPKNSQCWDASLFLQPPEPPSPTRGAEHQCTHSAACQSTLVSQHKKTRTEHWPLYVRDDVKWPEFLFYINFFFCLKALLLRIFTAQETNICISKFFK